MVFAVPVALAVGAVTVQATRGIPQFALEMFTPTVALTALVLIGLLCVWRLIAIVDAALIAGGRRALRVGRVGGTVAVLALITVVVHGMLGYYAWSFYQAGSHIFVGLPDPDGGVAPEPPASAQQGPILVATPAATPATVSSRINVLLTGIDSAPNRAQSLNDTIIVVSIDPVSKDVAMLSFPRDLSNLPLWDGRTYKGKINSLMTYAQGHRKEFPDGGLPTLMKELGFVLGVPMHYYAAIDLAGFVTMVDLVGGVTIDNPARDRRSGLRRLDQRRTRSASTSAPASTSSTARRPSPTPARAREPATMTSPGRVASNSSWSRWARSWPIRRCCPSCPTSWVPPVTRSGRTSHRIGSQRCSTSGWSSTTRGSGSTSSARRTRPTPTHRPGRTSSASTWTASPGCR